ncbi:hypothetical protein BB561_002535 [Smittium simulii]|uniref:Dolichyl-phosphate-mannose--protein mannosyltransferase n=1 Tax=Smittium simulii TaxID=133385 RepID=A0A2T9YQ09_9FUNG|nr:hypothetical protein BB561_002535 [Smittium simulii]
MTLENVRQRKNNPPVAHGYRNSPRVELATNYNDHYEQDQFAFSEKGSYSQNRMGPLLYDGSDEPAFQKKSNSPPANQKKFRFTKKRIIILALITIVAMYFRLWKLSNPEQVVFDEVHFGKHAGLYINRTYFFDVHPPLAKMMFAATGKFVGYDGKFDFKTIGLDMAAAKVPYAAMRFMPAILGVAVVPITYVTMASFGCSEEASILGSLFVAFENSFMTISRLILLDSILIFFTATTTMFWALFLREKNKPFTTKWWLYLILTGFNLGNALSSKWVGLFLVAAIGCATIKELWDVAIDYRNTFKTVNKYFWSLAVGLIAIPIATYMFWFAVHYSILNKSGPGDAFMSNEFQSELEGVTTDTTFLDVYYGSHVRISHVATNAGYLHSHSSRYNSGSKQQQVTLYSYRDSNNLWVIERSLENKVIYDNSTNKEDLAHIKDGDIIRLRHVSTRKHLHSHDVRAPVTNKDYVNEVSGYGDDSFEGDSNDHWTVRIMSGDKSIKDSDKLIKSVHTKFRLIHTNQKCALFSNRVKLPSWAFGQIETVCMKNAKYPKSIWRIVDSTHEKMDTKTAPVTHLKKLSFIEKFLESHEVMFRVNNGLVSSHPYDSRPGKWPLLSRGIGYWSKESKRIYLLGNPILWWLSFASVVTFAIVWIVILLRDKRGYKDTFAGTRNLYFNGVGFTVLSWALHYFPFYILKRQLFIHHYLPALWFGIVGLAISIDIFTRKLSQKFRHAIMIGLLFYTIRSYMVYSPLGYGTVWTKQACRKSKWFESWDYSCSKYPDATSFFSKKVDTSLDGKKMEEDLQEEPLIVPIENIEQEAKLNEPVPKLDKEDLKKLEKDWDKYKNEKVGFDSNNQSSVLNSDQGKSNPDKVKEEVEVPGIKKFNSEGQDNIVVDAGIN